MDARRIARHTGVPPCDELLDAGFDLSISIGSIPKFVKPLHLAGYRSTPERTRSITRSTVTLSVVGFQELRRGRRSSRVKKRSVEWLTSRIDICVPGRPGGRHIYSDI